MHLLRMHAGVKAAAQAAFVLVAGGLGERLGYSGIKLALPVDSASGKCFLQVRPSCIAYCIRESIRDAQYACQAAGNDCTTMIMSTIVGRCKANT